MRFCYTNKSSGFFYHPFSSGLVIRMQMKLSDNLAGEYRALKMELDVLNMSLETESDLRERGRIKERIDSITREMAEMKDLDNLAPPSMSTLLMNGLQNNIDEIDFALEREKDIKKREKLKEQKLICINALKDRQKPVIDGDSLGDAVEQIESDEHILSKLSSGQLDHVDLEFLLSSDMLPFIGSDFKGELQIALGQMFTSDSVDNALGRNRGNIFEDSDKAWMTHREKIKQDIEDLEESKRELTYAFRISGDEKEKADLRSRLREIESQIRYFEVEIKDGRINWTHRDRTKREKTASSTSLLKIVKPETVERLKRLIKEAQALRIEKIQEYLTLQFSELERKLQSQKEQGIFNEETLDSLEKELKEGRNLLIDSKITDPRLLARIAANIEDAKVQLSTSADEIKNVKENRAQVIEYVTRQYDRLHVAVSGKLQESLKRVIAEYTQKEAGGGTIKNNAILQKATRALTDLSNPKSELHTKIADISKRLQGIAEMDPEELLSFKQDLETMSSRIDILESMDDDHDAKMAHESIKELEKAKNPEEIEKILIKNLGKDHLELVNQGVFERDYKKYTQDGYMVFYESKKKSGKKDWGIILSRKALEEGADVEELKKQLTHELLHLEFEMGKNVKNDIHKELVEENPAKWKQIREAFIEMAKSTKKQPPEGDVWNDDDILSELYAMQNEMGRIWSKGDKPVDKLNNLLFESGIASDIKDKRKEYEDDKVGRAYRGYEKGITPNDDEEDDSPKPPEKVIFKRFENEIKAIADRIKSLQASDNLGDVEDAASLLEAMSAFNDGTSGLNDDLLKNPGSEILSSAITQRNTKISDDLVKVESQIGKAARNAPNTEIGLFRKLWIRTNFLSIESIVQVGIDVAEFIDRRHKRRNADQSARLGMALFSGTDLGREANARKQKAEAEEVDQWQSRYKNLSAQQLIDELKSMSDSLVPNSDQLKAVLRILAEKGRVDWRDPNLWNILNRLQSNVVLKPGDDLLLHNPILLRQRLNHALGSIFDYDEFTSLEQKNKSSYDSNKKGFYSVHNEMQNSLTDRLDELLHQKRAGETIDPILFESILEYCIENGKSYAENIFFHLISGMAEGLLTPERGLALGTLLNKWAAIDWFTTLQPPFSTADWRKFAEKNFGKSFKRGSITADGYGKDFKNFFWTVVQNNNRVVERVKKSVSERDWDHDWGRSIACLGDANTAKRFYSSKGGQEETKATAVGNAYVGAVQFLEENVKNPQVKRSVLARQAGWIMMSEGNLDGTAYNRRENDVSTRANEAMNRDIPRESGVGNHAGLNTIGHRQITRDFLLLIDRDFFSMLIGVEARTEQQKTELGIRARDFLIQKYGDFGGNMAQVESVDQIYDRTDLIISTMFEQMSEAKFQEILAITAARSSK